MGQIPTLTTLRLILRPFSPKDAASVKELAGEREIAEMTANIPYPYDEGMAEAWISGHQEAFDNEEAVTFAITRRSDGMLLGAIDIHINKIHRLAEIGYWIGKPFWSQGYCTEAAREVLRYGFEALNLNRIQARHMTKNPASGRVMEKLGMEYEGTLRQAHLRWDQFEDIAIYSILQDEDQGMA